MARGDQISGAFVELADTLVADYDVIDFLHLLCEHSMTLLGVHSAGVNIANAAGTLLAVASSSERMRDIELFEIQTQEGPCFDAWRTGGAVAEDDLPSNGRARWPRFTPAALERGYASTYALPLRLRSERLGALNLFSNDVDGLTAENQSLGQALADVASIGILHERVAREHAVVAEQLQGALESRIVLEQAKGVLSAQLDVTTDEAFSLLRAYARRNQVHLVDTARAAVERTLPLGELSTDPNR